MERSVSIASIETVQYPSVAGIVGGIVGGIGMGLVFHVGALMPVVGTLYGWPTVVGGWAVHMIHSVVLGLVFALIVSRPSIGRSATTTLEYVVYGIIYAAGVGLVTAGIVLPFAFNVMGVESFPEPVLPLPDVIGGVVTIVSVGVAHLVYGVLIGSIYGVVQVRPELSSGRESRAE